MTRLNPTDDYREWGAVCVISPHLDDAVLSCAHLLACCPGSTIITVLAGNAPSDTMQTAWDQLCGFDNAGDAMLSRRTEDRIAAHILGANVQHLSFIDGQYAAPAPLSEIATALSNALASIHVDTLLVPLGLHHSDHLHVAAACREKAFTCKAVRQIAYEEIPYRHIGSSVQIALTRLEQGRRSAAPVRWLEEPMNNDHAVQLKALALMAYSSQLRALPTDWLDDARTVESYWQLDALAQ